MKNQNTTYQRFLEKVHRNFITPHDIIVNAVIKATNSGIKTKTRLIIGESNEIYDIETENGRSIIVRISHKEDDRLFMERWAFEQVKKQHVPVPNILLLETQTLPEKTITICVEEKLPGKALSQVFTESTTDESYLKEMTEKAGMLLSQIHEVKLNGFGDLQKDGTPEQKDLLERVKQMTHDEKQAFLDAAKNSDLSETEVKKTFEVLVEYTAQFNTSENSLVHSDFGPKHIFVLDEEITGIIDFETCRAGDPVMDFSHWDFYYHDQWPLEWLKAGYSNKSIFTDEFDKKFQYYKLYLAILLLYWHNFMGNDEGMSVTVKNLRECLGYFSHI